MGGGERMRGNGSRPYTASLFRIRMPRLLDDWVVCWTQSYGTGEELGGGGQQGKRRRAGDYGHRGRGEGIHSTDWHQSKDRGVERRTRTDHHASRVVDSNVHHHRKDTEHDLSHEHDRGKEKKDTEPGKKHRTGADHHGSREVDSNVGRHEKETEYDLGHKRGRGKDEKDTGTERGKKRKTGTDHHGTSEVDSNVRCHEKDVKDKESKEKPGKVEKRKRKSNQELSCYIDVYKESGSSEELTLTEIEGSMTYEGRMINTKLIVADDCLKDEKSKHRVQRKRRHHGRRK